MIWWACAFHFVRTRSTYYLNLQIVLEFFNPFVPNAPFLHPLKTLENCKFSDIFRG